MPLDTAANPKPNWFPLAAGAALAGLILWAYWPAFGDMAEKWQSDPQYSHGYLVPLFAVGLAVWRRNSLDVAECRPDWRGLFLVALGAAVYVVGGYLYLDFVTAGALIPTLFGAVLLVGGWAALKWAWPMAAFLAFMIPLPFALETALSFPLRGVATQGSTWVLQTLGLPAVAEGHVIILERGRIAVVEACSGLSMLLTFAAMTTAVAMVSTRPVLDRLILILSTVPVALAVNIARISLNGIAIEVWNPEVANKWFHDQGGWVMMPLALALLGFELWVLGRLFVEAPTKTSVPIVGLPPTAPRTTAAAAS